MDDWKRETAGQGVAVRIYSLAAVVQGSNEANPEILPGDIINIPKAAPVYVTGEVKKAGELDLPAIGLPLTQAIAMANGNTPEAKTKDVKIYRRKQGSVQPEVIVANLQAIKKGTAKDIMLQPYDIVEVGKAQKSIGQILIDAITGLPGRVPIPIP
jgi:polysaccharide export outer membrane protein